MWFHRVDRNMTFILGSVNTILIIDTKKTSNYVCNKRCGSQLLILIGILVLTKTTAGSNLRFGYGGA
jgi:hypothetical protein